MARLEDLAEHAESEIAVGPAVVRQEVEGLRREHVPQDQPLRDRQRLAHRRGDRLVHAHRVPGDVAIPATPVRQQRVERDHVQRRIAQGQVAEEGHHRVRRGHLRLRVLEVLVHRDAGERLRARRDLEHARRLRDRVAGQRPRVAVREHQSAVARDREARRPRPGRRHEVLHPRVEGRERRFRDAGDRERRRRRHVGRCPDRREAAGAAAARSLDRDRIPTLTGEGAVVRLILGVGHVVVRDPVRDLVALPQRRVEVRVVEADQHRAVVAVAQRVELLLVLAVVAADDQRSAGVDRSESDDVRRTRGRAVDVDRGHVQAGGCRRFDVVDHLRRRQPVARPPRRVGELPHAGESRIGGGAGRRQDAGPVAERPPGVGEGLVARAVQTVERGEARTGTVDPGRRVERGADRAVDRQRDHPIALRRQRVVLLLVALRRDVVVGDRRLRSADWRQQQRCEQEGERSVGGHDGSSGVVQPESRSPRAGPPDGKNSAAARRPGARRGNRPAGRGLRRFGSHPKLRAARPS